MANETFKVMNIYEQAKRLDPDGRPAKIAEILDRIDSVFQDAPSIEANDQNSHLNTIRFGLPIPAIRRINEGAALSMSTTKQLREELMLLEDWVRIDEKILEMQTDQKRFRYNEIIAHLEGMRQAFQDNFWYGNAAEIGEINGLTTRFNTLGGNVIDGGGSATLSSAWLIEWGEMKSHLLYPRGSTAGIDDEDKGKITVWKDDKPFDAYVNKVRMQFGVNVVDSSSAQRVCNIDSSPVQTTGSLRDAATIAKLIAAMNELPMAGEGAKMYVNRKLKAQMDIMAYDKTNAAFNYMEVQGKVITTFFGMQIRLAEGLINAETKVTS
jgi:hypothetical protein